MLDLDIEIQNLKDKAKLEEVYLGISGPVLEEHIAKLEAAMQLSLPPVYRRLIQKFGYLAYCDDFISGIVDDDPLGLEGSNIYGDTHFLREDFPDLPPTVWCISRHDDGAYCIDATKMSSDTEYYVYNYEGKPEHFDEPVCDSVETFLKKFYFEK